MVREISYTKIRQKPYKQILSELIKIIKVRKIVRREIMTQSYLSKTLVRLFLMARQDDDQMIMTIVESRALRRGSRYDRNIVYSIRTRSCLRK